MFLTRVHHLMSMGDFFLNQPFLVNCKVLHTHICNLVLNLHQTSLSVILPNSHIINHIWNTSIFLSNAPFTPEEVPATSLKFRRNGLGRSANFVVFEKCEIVPCMLRPRHVLAKFMLRSWCSHWVYCARRRGPCGVETVPTTSSLRPSRLRLVVPTSPSREYNDPAGQHLFHSYSRGQIGNTPDLPLRPASCRQRRVNKSRHPREVGRNSMKAARTQWQWTPGPCATTSSKSWSTQFQAATNHLWPLCPPWPLVRGRKSPPKRRSSLTSALNRRKTWWSGWRQTRSYNREAGCIQIEPKEDAPLERKGRGYWEKWYG